MGRIHFGLVLVLSVSLLTAALPVQADSTLTNTQQADALKAAGLFAGTPTGYDLGRVLTRDQGLALALRAQGKDGEVKSQTVAQVDAALSNVADLSKIAVWARPYVAYALRQNPAITSGVEKLKDGRIKFGASNQMSGPQFVTFMVRAMGYNASLTTGGEMAINAKIMSVGEFTKYAAIGQLTRGGAVDIMHHAVQNGVPKDYSGTVIQKLVREGHVTAAGGAWMGYTVPVATPVPTPTPQPALGVASVNALSAKQISVVFNRDVRADSLSSSRFDVYDNGYVSKAITPVLQSDKRTVLLTINGQDRLTNGTNARVVVKKDVRDTNSTRMNADVNIASVPVRDQKAPECVGVSAAGSRLVRLTFDEPVWDGSSDAILNTSMFTVQQNGTYYGISEAKCDYPARTITLTLASNLPFGNAIVRVNAAGAVNGAVMDFAGYTASLRDVPFTCAPATSNITASLGNLDISTRTVTVTFSSPVYGTNVRLYHSAPGVEAYATAPVSKTEAQASKYWTFTFTNAVPQSNLTVWLRNSGVAGQQLTDGFGAVVPDTSFNTTVTADRTVPKVSSIKLVNNTAIDVAFNEPVDAFEASRTYNYSVKTSSGSVVGVNSATLQSDRTTVRLGVSLSDGVTYKVYVVSMRDTSGNIMGNSGTTTLSPSDSTSPQTSSATATTAEGRIDIYFNEPMNGSDLWNASLYRVDLDGGTDNFVTLGSQDTLSVPDSQHVRIYLKNPIKNPSVRLGQMRDLAGNRIGSSSTNGYSGSNNNLLNIPSSPLTLESVTLVSANQVKLVFNGKLNNIEKTDFQFLRSTDGKDFQNPLRIAYTGSWTLEGQDRQVVVATLDREIPTDGLVTENGQGIPVEVQVVGNTTKSYGGARVALRNHAEALRLKDGAAPMLLSTTTLSNGKNGTIKVSDSGDIIQLMFSEAVQPQATGTTFGAIILDGTDNVLTLYRYSPSGNAADKVATITLSRGDYVSTGGSMSFRDCSSQWSNGNRTLTITLGTRDTATPGMDNDGSDNASGIVGPAVLDVNGIAGDGVTATTLSSLVGF